MAISCFVFEEGYTDVGEDKLNSDILGGKGHLLCRMADSGLPVPPGLVIPVTDYMSNRKLTDSEFNQINHSLVEVLGNPYIDVVMPLVSVRSGAPVSMPGMMDTILNVGMAGENVSYWANFIGERLAYDCYRRLIRMFGETCFEIDKRHFDKKYKEISGYKYGLKEIPKNESEFNVTHYQKLAGGYSEIIGKYRSITFSDLTVEQQIRIAVNSVWRSWMSERAIAYRKNNGIADDMGTGVIIQKMVFGNRNEDSCTGVLFTRNPNTGSAEIYGEYLTNAQGEDVVAGTITPKPISELATEMPVACHKLYDIALKLEEKYNDMQDIEFTIDSGELYILQTRTGKRSAKAAFRIAHDYWSNAKITKEEMIYRISRTDVLGMMKEQVSPEFDVKPLVIGLPAAGTVASGEVVLKSEDAINCTNPCILVKKETLPDDYSGMVAAEGVLTMTGGATSHAAVVGRSINKPCVVGCGDLEIGVNIFEGDKITIDGSTGRVWKDVEVPVEKSALDEYSKSILKIIDSKIDGKDFSVDIEDYKFYQQISEKELWIRAPFDKNRVYDLIYDLVSNEVTGGVYVTHGNAYGFNDGIYNEFMGLPINSTTAGEIVGAIISVEVPEHVAKNIKIYIDEVSIPDIEVLRSYGYDVVSKIYDLHSLFNSGLNGGMLELTHDFGKQLSENNVFLEDITKFFGDNYSWYATPIEYEPVFLGEF